MTARTSYRPRGRIEGDTLFLDPVAASRLAGLDLVARFIVEGFLIGLHKSPYHGFSAEFSSYREYSPGDDTRRVDWKVYGRTDRFYLKEFEENTNLTCYVILDCSGSMGTGGGGRCPSKFDYARSLTAALVYLVLKQQDAAGLAAFSSEAVRLIPPRARPRHLTDVLSALAGLRPGGRTDPARGLAGLPERMRRRGLVIFLSDCLVEPEPLLEVLKAFRVRGHELVVFQMLSPEERRFPYRELVEFEDAETGTKVTAHGADIRHAYLGALGRHSARLRGALGEMDADFVELTTDTRYDVALVEYLAKRRRLR